VYPVSTGKCTSLRANNYRKSSGGIFASYQFLTGLFNALPISKYLHVSKISVTPQKITHHDKAKGIRHTVIGSEAVPREADKLYSRKDIRFT
jgi:hypothetical protein